MRPFVVMFVLLTVVVFTLSGCLAPFLGVLGLRVAKESEPEAAVVVPAALLRGRAAHLQDSLALALSWLSARTLPGRLQLERLAFVGPDEAPELLAHLRDPQPVNAHRADREGLRERATARIRELAPLVADVHGLGIEQPLRLRVRFIARDQVFGTGGRTTDSVDVVWTGVDSPNP